LPRSSSIAVNQPTTSPIHQLKVGIKELIEEIFDRIFGEDIKFSLFLDDGAVYGMVEVDFCLRVFEDGSIRK
jgi:hypothetical protein